MPAAKKDRWFRVNAPLDERRGFLLTVCSFLIPVLAWCAISYLPFLNERGYQLTISGDPSDKEAFGATYTQGSVLEEENFRAFQDAVKADNRVLSEIREKGGEFEMSGRKARRYNRKILRSFEPVLAANGWVDPEEKTVMGSSDYNKRLDRLSYEKWSSLASGGLKAKPGTLSEENLAIIRENWSLLKAVSPTYDSQNFLSEPMLQLVPQGEKILLRESYLPAPHEVIQKGWEDFTGRSELGELSVWKKYGESLRVVLSGFILACVIGVPIALIAGTFSFFSKLIEPFTDFFRYMPAPAFSTVLVAVFGLAHAPKAALVVLGTLPHLILMVSNTTRMVDGQLLDASQTLGAQGSKMVRKVVIPSILPNLYNDLRILLGWAWTWLVIAELIGQKSGLTEIIDTQGRRFHFDHVYPVILLIGLTGFLTDQFLAALRPVLFPWTRTEKLGMLGRLFLMPMRAFRKAA